MEVTVTWCLGLTWIVYGSHGHLVSFIDILYSRDHRHFISWINTIYSVNHSYLMSWIDMDIFWESQSSGVFDAL